MSKVAYIFIDESGDTGLDFSKAGTQEFMTYAAVVISEEHISSFRVKLVEIQSKFFQGHPIKAKQLKNDSVGNKKRLGVLKALSTIPHYVCALVIDKPRLKSEGFSHKDVYIKYFQRFLGTDFHKMYEEYHIVFDKTGGIPFQDSLQQYISNHGIGRNLFSDNTYELKDDVNEEQLLQLADLYANTIQRVYSGKLDGQLCNQFTDIIPGLNIEWFPEDIICYSAARAIKGCSFDKDIAEIAIKTAQKFKDTYLNDPDEKQYIPIIDILLQEFSKAPMRSVSSGEVNSKLQAIGHNQTNILNAVRHLRDKGVFIISPLTKKGFKFPCNEKEVADFFDRISVNVIPQLRRGYELNDLLTSQSMGKYNILKEDTFELLKSLMEISKRHHL